MKKVLLMLFVLNSVVTIGSATTGPFANAHQSFKFSGVHDVKIRKSIHSVVQTATLTLPMIALYIPKNGSVPVTVTMGTQFFDGDPITIELGYDGQMKEEFKGFVKRRSLNKDLMLVVECEGYSYVLRNNVSLSADYTKKPTSAKALLQLACKGTGIDVICPVDFTLQGIQLVQADGLRICDYIKQASDGVLGIWFVNATTLWCGLVYTGYSGQSTANMFGLPTLRYWIGFNTPPDNGLKERIPSEPVQVTLKGKYATGVQIYTQSKAKYAVRKMQSIVNHTDQTSAALFAQEKEYQHNYTGYEGKLRTFLQPYIQPGYDAYIKSSQYPDLTGTYLAESVEVDFGVNGGWRSVEIGPRVGFGTLPSYNALVHGQG